MIVLFKYAFRNSWQIARNNLPVFRGFAKPSVVLLLLSEFEAKMTLLKYR